MTRIMLEYQDGVRTYALYSNDDAGRRFVVGKVDYTVDDIKRSNATVVVNNSELLREMIAIGLPARPTPAQATITISVSQDTKEKMKKAAAKVGRTVSSILDELAKGWLESL